MSRAPTLLITGAAGFLGSWVARHAAALGWALWGVDRNVPRIPGTPSFIRFDCCDLLANSWQAGLERLAPWACIHCAGSSSVGNSMTEPEADFVHNVTATHRLLEALRKTAPGCRTVLLSSGAVYGQPERLPVAETDPLRPLSPYGFHKWQSELAAAEYAQVHGLPTAVARVFSAYGPGLPRQVVHDLIHKALRNGRLDLQGTGAESRDFIHGRDVAAALCAILLRAPMRGEAYNVASGQETRIRELAALVAEVVDTSLPISFSGHAAAGMPQRWHADISRLSALGITPSVPLRVGVQDVVAWCHSQAPSAAAP